MPTNFTPLPSSVAHGKGAVDVNVVLIIIALAITILLGVFMWFMITQKQQEEKQSQTLIEQLPKKTADVVVDESLPVASPSALPTPDSTATKSSSPSATITP